MKLLARWSSFLHVAVALWLLATGRLLSWSPYAWAPQLAAFALAAWAYAAFPRGQFSVFPEPRRPSLVEAGPYRWIRHPMYTATELAIWPGLLRSPSVETLALGAVMVALLVVRVREEERLLVASVPGYDAYMRRTRRLVPFVF